MIHSKEDKVTLIVYDSPEPPKIFNISKKVLKVALIATPLVLVAALLASLVYSVMVKRNLIVEKSKEPAIIKELKSKNQFLSTEIEELKRDRQNLTQKITEGAEGSSSDFLPLFSKPLGFQDKTNLDLIKLDNIRHQIVNNRVILKFDLHNNGPSNSKVSGRIFIVLYTQDTLSIYPSVSPDKIMDGINFTMGEKFIASRFRPSEASFELPSKAKEAFFKLLIFSSLGDLSHKKTIGPINLEEDQ